MRKFAIKPSYIYPNKLYLRNQAIYASVKAPQCLESTSVRRNQSPIQVTAAGYKKDGYFISPKCASHRKARGGQPQHQPAPLCENGSGMRNGTPGMINGGPGMINGASEPVNKASFLVNGVYGKRNEVPGNSSGHPHAGNRIQKSQ